MREKFNAAAMPLHAVTFRRTLPPRGRFEPRGTEDPGLGAA